MFEIGKPLHGPRDPEPEDGATDVYRDIELNWTPGGYAGARCVPRDRFRRRQRRRSRPIRERARRPGPGEAATYDPRRLELRIPTTAHRRGQCHARCDDLQRFGVGFTTSRRPTCIENITVTSNGVSDEDWGGEHDRRLGLNDDDQHSVTHGDVAGHPDGENPIWIRMSSIASINCTNCGSGTTTSFSER